MVMKHKIDTNSGTSAQNNKLIVLSILAVIIYYLWLSGSDTTGTTTHYYTRLADSFLKGKLYVMGIGRDIPIDLSYYNGKYYLYWGPVPALLLAPIQLLSQVPIGDFFLAFVFGIGVFLVQSFLLIDLWERYFNALPKWTIHISIFLSGLVAPVYTLRHHTDHARIYEAAIVGGQFFLMIGLLMAFTGVIRPSISSWRLVAAGLFWALAIGTRNILAAPIGFMVLLTVAFVFKINIDLIEKIKKLASLGLPLLFGFAGLLWYNWARFGSITETGFSYALASIDLQAHTKELFSRAYIFQNLYNYLLHPPAFLSKFPFVYMINGNEEPILSLYNFPDIYSAQPITGLLFIFPFAVFSVVPLILFLTKVFKTKAIKNIFEHKDIPNWILLILSGSFLTTFTFLLFFFWTGVRYLGDFLPSLAVLSILGFWQGYKLLGYKKVEKYIYTVVGFTLAGISIMVSTLLAISTNSELVDRIVNTFRIQ